MTRHYAARKLLRLGGLTLGQFVEITGWPRRECRRVLYALRRSGVVSFTGSYQSGHYAIGWEYD